MFNHPTLLYWCWKDAEREARRNPNQNDNGFGGCLLILGIIFMVCLLKACFAQGGWGILFGIVILCAFLQGLFEK
jgi:hypothetical protein